MKNETLYGEHDGLVVNDVKSWAPEKYRTLQLYAHFFTKGMKGKWKSLTYLDLYAGAGKSQIEGTNQILLGSPLIALSLDIPFDLYVFCERDPAKRSALEERVGKQPPTIDVKFVPGDCDDPKFKLEDELPRGCLTLCFVDPYSLDIRFDTIRGLAKGRNIDFLCLLASRMDAGRNPHNYLREESTKLDRLLGSREWRARWEELRKQSAHEPNLGDFVCKEFAFNMESLGYLPTEMHEMKTIKTDEGRLIYHLALFSKDKVAKRYWQQASNYSQPQRELPF